MIDSVEIKSGILDELLGKSTYQFKPDVNIIWGRNGIGKSLLTKTMAKYCFVDLVSGGGWSKDETFFMFNSYSYQYDEPKKTLSEVHEFDKDSKLEIEWSGQGVFYMHHDDMIDWYHIMGYEMGGASWIPGLGRISDRLRKDNGYHPSSGQQILTLTKMLTEIEPLDITIERSWAKNQSYDSDFISYVKERQKEYKGEVKKPTLILDEVDSQLDLQNQLDFHNTILPKLSEKFQVILVSHSVFALTHENIIDLDGSSQQLKETLKTIK